MHTRGGGRGGGREETFIAVINAEEFLPLSRVCVRMYRAFLFSVCGPKAKASKPGLCAPSFPLRLLLPYSHTLPSPLPPDTP